MAVAPNFVTCSPGAWVQAWAGSTLLLGGRLPLWIQLAPGTPPGPVTVGWRLYSSAPPHYWAGSVTGRPSSGSRPPSKAGPPNAALAPIFPATYADLWLTASAVVDVAT